MNILLNEKMCWDEPHPSRIPRASFGHLVDLRFYMLGRHYSHIHGFSSIFFSEVCLPLWLYLFCSVEYFAFVQGDFKVIFYGLYHWIHHHQGPAMWENIWEELFPPASYGANPTNGSISLDNSYYLLYQKQVDNLV